jgi:hypothetical protein
MAKPTALSPALMAATPVALQTTTAVRRAPVTELPTVVVKADTIPLQIRLPREAVRAIKIAAAQREQTISDFMLACFHADMKARGHD